MDRKKLLIWMVILMFFIFGVDHLAQVKHLYYKLAWFDVFMHFISGFWVALFFFYFFRSRGNFFKELFIILVWVLLVGVLWEIFEVWRDTIAHEKILMGDTLSDLVWDVAGGTVATFYFLRGKNITG